MQTARGERSCWVLTGYVLPLISSSTELTLRSDDADCFWDRLEKPDLLGQSLTLYVSPSHQARSVLKDCSKIWVREIIVTGA